MLCHVDFWLDRLPYTCCAPCCSKWHHPPTHLTLGGSDLRRQVPFCSSVALLDCPMLTTSYVDEHCIYTDGWKTEWTNEWTNERTNEWMNERTAGLAQASENRQEQLQMFSCNSTLFPLPLPWVFCFCFVFRIHKLSWMCLALLCIADSFILHKSSPTQPSGKQEPFLLIFKFCATYFPCPVEKMAFSA